MGEHVEAVAIGDTWAAAATSSLYLRLFSYSGIQKGLLSLPGPIVAMVGDASQLAVVYHDGVGLPGSQHLALMIMNVDTGKVQHQGTLPLSRKSTLTWLGFSDDGLLVTADSNGVYRVVLSGSGYMWCPLLDTKTLPKAERPWPIAVIGNQLLNVKCKGALQYPVASPERPVPELLSLQMPFMLGSKDEKAMEQIILTKVMDEEIAAINGTNVSSRARVTRDINILRLVKQVWTVSVVSIFPLYTTCRFA